MTSLMTGEQVKIRFTFEDGQVETLWADRVSDDQFRLDNTPWYAYRVSVEDIVIARPNPEDGYLEFVEVVKKSGNRTLRLILDPPANKSETSMAILKRLREMGCSYEGANGGYLAIVIPSQVDLSAISEYLISTGQKWENADPTWEDLQAAQPVK